MQIDGWLRGIGLEQYAQTFRDNAIDADVLCELTDEHLRELGLSMGARLKLLRAVAALNTGQTSVSPEITTHAPRTAPQRRQVTVMFSDLVGSTALSARMDPEDLREIISAYHQCVAKTVQHFGGFVAKYMGDGVLIYFGYPQAHEDDAERAVRAGLEFVAAVTSLKTHAALQTRVGIATGLVVVGDLIGSGASQEQGIVGETPNLAARLQGVAEPNSVVIAESTRRLVGNLFEFDDLGAQDIKGIAGRVRAWAALRPSSVESRFEALHAGGLMDLVGREEELELLLRRWSKAKAGEGQVILLFGEAGIGKSRLTAALMEHASGEAHTRVRYFCSPQNTDSALYPIVSQMERAAGFTYDDTVQSRLDKIDAVLAQSSTSPQDATLLMEMLSLPNDGRYPKLELTPEQRRRKTMEALTANLEALSRSNPVLMIFEDVHWADPSSLEVLGRMVDRLRTLGVLLIITYRPDFDPPWMGRSYVTMLNLNRLGEREVAALVERVIGNRSLPENIRQDIIERADGIPLFVEEMTRAVLESETEGEARSTAAGSDPSPLAVPASLHASLMARLDRLGSAKEVAQIGAAIGREFSHPLLAAVADRSEGDLSSALDRIIAAGLLFRQGSAPHAIYLFKHALVQNAAYGTLLREPRRALHARIAEAVKSQFAEIADTQPELLARHYMEAGQIKIAATLWGKAGQRSVERSALVEAAEQLARALTLLASLAPTPDLRSEQIKLQVALINPLMHVKGFAAPETKAAAERARLLLEQAEACGERLEDPLILFSILYDFWVTNQVAFNGGRIRELAEQFLVLAEKQADSVPLTVGHRLMGTSLMQTGCFAEGRAHLDQAMALCEANNPPQATQFGIDVRISILCYRSWTLWMLGYPKAALADAEYALDEVRQIDQAATFLYTLVHVSFLHMFCGNYEAASSEATELLTLARKKDTALWKASGLMNQGDLLSLFGRASDATPMIISGIADYESTGATIYIPWHLSRLAWAYAELSQFDEAQRYSDQAIAVLEATNERWSEAEVHRIAGEIVLMSPDRNAAKAEDYFERALEVARHQKAKSWELRAATSLARLWRDQGRPQQARELLAAVYEWFTEGHDTLDLKEAMGLLDELRA